MRLAIDSESNVRETGTAAVVRENDQWPSSRAHDGQALQTRECAALQGCASNERQRIQWIVATLRTAAA